MPVNYDPIFSTGRDKTRRRVSLPSIGISTVLFSDWRQTSPDTFEYTNAEGQRAVLTFEKLPRANLEPGLGSDAMSLLGEVAYRQAGRYWESFFSDGNVKLVTVEDDTAYLITLEGFKYQQEEELSLLTLELYGLVAPTMLRNFKIDEQPFSTFKLDGQPFSTFEIELYGVYTPPAPQDETDEP